MENKSRKNSDWKKESTAKVINPNDMKRYAEQGREDRTVHYFHKVESKFSFFSLSFHKVEIVYLISLTYYNGK